MVQAKLGVVDDLSVRTVKSAVSKEADTKLRNALCLSKAPSLESPGYFSGPESCFMFAVFADSRSKFQ